MTDREKKLNTDREWLCPAENSLSIDRDVRMKR